MADTLFSRNGRSKVVTPMPRSTIAQVLECFDGEFADVASAFARGEYLLWLGSGISRDVVPPVPELLEQMLHFLQTSSDAADPNCRFKAALEEVLDIAGGPAKRVDIATPVTSWPDLDDIVERLVDKYADVLDVQVRDEPDDFLVWTGLNVPSTYGDPGLEPDIEHLCVAMLMLEGVVRSAPTTNWDGLVEAAMKRLTGGVSQALKVVVTASDFAAPDRQAELVKFHGCAVRSADDPGEYRHLLIARRTQIAGWTTKPQNQMMKNRLEYLFASRPAFFVGLSAQDANIQTVLHQAIQNLARNWPTDPPAVIFAEQALHVHHRHVMKLTYGDSFSSNSQAIASSALLGAYAKPALLGLVLYTLADKLSELIGHIEELNLPAAEMNKIQQDVRNIRDSTAVTAQLDYRSFIDATISVLTIGLWIFRKGSIPPTSSYPAISSVPIREAAENPDFPGPSLGRFALACTLIGRGFLAGTWALEAGSTTTPGSGVLRAIKGSRLSKIFIVRDARALSELERAGIIDMADPEVMVAQAEAIHEPKTRSPRSRYGRSGKSGARQVDLEFLCASATTADELFANFVLAGAL